MCQQGRSPFAHKFMPPIKSSTKKESTSGAFKRLTLATRVPTLPVCSDIKGAVSSVATPLAG